MRYWWILGIACAAGLMVKITTVWMMVATAICLWVLYRKRRDAGGIYWAKRAAASLGPGVVFFAMWSAHSIVSYGTFLPITFTDSPMVPAGLWACFLLPEVGLYVVYKTVSAVLATMAFPFWLARPYMWPVAAIMGGLAVLAAPAVAGYVRSRRERRRGWEDTEAWHTSIGAAWLAGTTASMVSVMLICIQDIDAMVTSGRYLLSMLPLSSLAWVVGMHRFIDSPRARWILMGLLFAILLILGILGCRWVIAFHNGLLPPAPAPMSIGFGAGR
jgi:hypothetical protein